MALPNVTVDKFETIFINDTVAVSSFFSVSDADNDPVTRYQFDASTIGGYFELNGNPFAQGQAIDIAASQLANLTYVGGPTVEKEQVNIRAFAGGEWSNTASTMVHTVRNQGTQPLVQATDFTVLVNETDSADEYISAFDPDGWPILDIMIRDRYLDNSYYTLNGVVLAQTQFHTIAYDELANLEYHAFGNGGSEPIDIFAYDGDEWSDRTTVMMSRRKNINAPTVRFTATQVPTREAIRLDSVVEFHDSDGNSIKGFSAYDTSVHDFSGYLTFDGVKLSAQEWHHFSIDDFYRVEYVGAERSFNENIALRATDGARFSDITRVVLTSVVKPIIVTDYYHETLQLVDSPVAPMFRKVDPGPSHNRFEIVDMTRSPSNIADETGFIFGAGIPKLNQGQVYNMSSGEFASLQFHSAPYGDRVNDELFARAWNGLLWGDWVRVNVRTESEYDTLGVDHWNNYLAVLPQPRVVTYSFMQGFPDYEQDSGEAEGTPFSRFTADQRRGTRRSFQNIQEFANVTFVEVADSPQAIIRHGNYFLDTSTTAAYAFFPGESPDNPGLSDVHGDIWINTALVPTAGWGYGSFAQFVHMHELGHAMGMKHPHSGPPVHPVETDNTSLSVMSYVSERQYEQPPITGEAIAVNAASYMIYDLYNLQMLYGPNLSHNTGDNVYDMAWLGGQNFSRAIWDAGGTDTLSSAGSNSPFGTYIDLREGMLSYVGNTTQFATTSKDNAGTIGIGFDVAIENAIGSIRSDTITGNAYDNVLTGGRGNDVLAGMGGNDVLTGNEGNDTFHFGVGDGDDQINEMAGAGRDLLEIRDFPGIDDLGDLRFRTVNLDLIVEVTVDGGNVESELTIYRQKWGRYRVESLRIGGVFYDLTDVYAQATPDSQEFARTNNNSKFGFLVAPV